MTKTDIRNALLMLGDMRADLEFVLDNGNDEEVTKVRKLYREAMDIAVDGFYDEMQKPFEDQLKANLARVWGL